MAEVRKLWSKKNSVVFVWPGEERLEIRYDGMPIVVPPRDVIGRVGLGSPYTHEAAEVGGRKVPGTAVIEDVTTITPEGGYRTALAIDHLCRYLTRDRDDLFGRGFNVVESVDQIQEAITLGIPLYAESQVRRAREVLSREMQRQKTYKDRGETPPASTSEKLIAWAVNHLRSVGPQQQAHRLEDLTAVMEGRAEAPASAGVREGPHIPSPALSSGTRWCGPERCSRPRRRPASGSTVSRWRTCSAATRTPSRGCLPRSTRVRSRACGRKRRPSPQAPKPSHRRGE